MDELKDGWMVGCIERKMDEQFNVRKDGLKEVRKDGWKEGCIKRLTDR